MKRGHCSACGADALMAPSGRWYHVGRLACPQRSWTIWQPVIVDPDGTMRQARDDEKWGTSSSGRSSRLLESCGLRPAPIEGGDHRRA